MDSTKKLIAKQVESASRPERQCVPFHYGYDDSIPQEHDEPWLKEKDTNHNGEDQKHRTNKCKTAHVISIKPIKHLEYLSFFRCAYIISYYIPKVND